MSPTPDDAARQLLFHTQLFGSFLDWDRAFERITDFTGAPRHTAGLEQLGHFGPNGCDLVADVGAQRLGKIGPARIAELGSGYGGALRYVASRMADHGVMLERAIGLELVEQHANLSARIDRSVEARSTAYVCADASAAPFGSASLNFIFAAGSLPHFRRPDAAFREARRVLRPGGSLVFLEEVSLRRPSVPLPADFRRFHPEGVFFLASLDERIDQLAAAGFKVVAIRDLSEWAIALLEQRLRVVRLFAGSANRIFGDGSVRLIEGTLTSALEAIAAQALRPSLMRCDQGESN